MIFLVGLQHAVTNESPVLLFVADSDAFSRVDKELASPASIQGEFAQSFIVYRPLLIRLMHV